MNRREHAFCTTERSLALPFQHATQDVGVVIGARKAVPDYQRLYWWQIAGQRWRVI